MLRKPFTNKRKRDKLIVRLRIKNLAETLTTWLPSFARYKLAISRSDERSSDSSQAKATKTKKETSQMANNNKSNTDTKVKTPRNFDRPMSLLMLFVVASIAYSTYVVYFGTLGIVPKIMLVPQALFAAVIAIHKFAK